MKKLFIFGIVLLMLVSSVSAFKDPIYDWECSTDPADYIDSNNALSYGAGIHTITLNTTIPALEENFTMFLENFYYVGENSGDPMIWALQNPASSYFAGTIWVADEFDAKDDSSIITNIFPVSQNVYYNWTFHFSAIDDIWYMYNGNALVVDGFGMDTHTLAPSKVSLQNVVTSLNIESFYIWNGTAGCPTDTPPASSSSLNISTNPQPEDNTQFNTQQLNFNVSYNASFQVNASLYINGTLNQTTDNFSSGVDQVISFNVSFIESIEINNTYQIRVYDDTIRENTTTKSFIIDDVDPVINGENINNSHQERELTYSINVSDNFLYSFNLNDSCGNNYANTSVNSPFFFTNPYIISNCSIGLQHTNISVCDGETGGLNCISETYYWNKTALVNITVFDVVSGAFIETFTINDSSKSISTTNGNVTFWSYSIGNYSLTVNAAGYEVKTETVGIDSLNSVYQYDVYTTNSINITFRNEISGDPILNTNFSLEFVSDLVSYNYTTNTTNGRYFVDLLSPTDYTIRYSADSYGRLREYIFTLTNRTHNNINLYLIPNSNSTETTVTVYDEVTINTIEGAIVYLQRYFQSENVYKTVAMYSTDITGKSYFDIEHDKEKYKFLIDYPFNTRKLTTNPFYVSETSLNLYISLLTDAAESFFNKESIIYTLNYDSGNNEFDLSYTDSELIATNYCFTLKKWGQYLINTVNQSCTSSPSSSISLSGLTENTTYYAVFSATIDGEDTILASLWKTIKSDKLNSGSLGLFLTAIIVITAAFVGSLHIYSLIFINIALIFAQIIGILTLGWGAIVVVMITSIILSIIISTKK